MAVVALEEPYAVWQLRQSVKESLQSHGEESILVHTFHAVADQGTQPRCHCFDDIYQQTDNYDCPDCFNTTFRGGIKEFGRVWGMFTDIDHAEQVTSRGVWTPARRTMQTEHAPVMMQRDYVVRVSQWGDDYRPAQIEGVYVVDRVTVRSLRTGGKHGQVRNDIVAQEFATTLLQDTHPIYQWARADRVVPRLDGGRR